MNFTFLLLKAEKKQLETLHILKIGVLRNLPANSHSHWKSPRIYCSKGYVSLPKQILSKMRAISSLFWLLQCNTSETRRPECSFTPNQPTRLSLSIFLFTFQASRTWGTRWPWRTWLTNSTCIIRTWTDSVELSCDPIFPLSHLLLFFLWQVSWVICWSVQNTQISMYCPRKKIPSHWALWWARQNPPALVTW